MLLGTWRSQARKKKKAWLAIDFSLFERNNAARQFRVEWLNKLDALN